MIRSWSGIINQQSRCWLAHFVEAILSRKDSSSCRTAGPIEILWLFYRIVLLGKGGGSLKQLLQGGLLAVMIQKSIFREEGKKEVSGFYGLFF